MTGLGAFVLSLVLVAGSAASAPSELTAELGIDTPDLAALQTPPAELRYRDSGIWAGELNRRLAAAGFHASTGESFGYQTRHAVYAFQKHHGLDRNGVFTGEMWNLLDGSPELTWRREANRVEVDLAKQVLYLVEDHEVRFVLPISSGNGEPFVNSAGNVVAARTPEGKFAFQRVWRGLRVSYLGELYNPYYFLGGYAIHGSPSVPNYPASHGCIRVTNWDMDLLREHLEVGQTLYIYGLRTDAPPRETIHNPPPAVL